VVKYAIEEDPVLLLGETGVGKSYVAELIHLYSGRPGEFIVVNTPGIPDTLIEAQLFGHRKGAFSGAISENEGYVTAAAGGTLFLDEIAEVQPPLQAKLLRFIDTQMYHRLGESRERRADVRIIAATNQDLQTAIAEKTFREDLFFRLNCLTIEIPPLRRRREDILTLIDENRGLLRGKMLNAEAAEILKRYDWPGNIRELKQVLKVTGIHSKDPIIGAEIAGLLTFHDFQKPAVSGKSDAIWQELIGGLSFWAAVKEPYLKRDVSRDEVKEIIERGLRETKGKYIGLLKLFNLDENEYKNFMRFLYANKLK
jgi:transcriptional regulator with PAS, ATPase and Fis domain